MTTTAYSVYVSKDGTAWFKLNSYVSRKTNDGRFVWVFDRQMAFHDKRTAKKSKHPIGGLHNVDCTRLQTDKIDAIYSNDNH